jgi:hypothetical protein
MEEKSLHMAELGLHGAKLGLHIVCTSSQRSFNAVQMMKHFIGINVFDVSVALKRYLT